MVDVNLNGTTTPSISMATIYVNGKFTSQRITGVQRLAWGLVEALDAELNLRPTSDKWILLCPIGSNLPTLRHIEVRSSGYRWFGLHAWEQFYLPMRTAGHTLLNLAGPAPLFKWCQVCMLPDAAVFDQPEAYTRAFGVWYRMLFRSLAHSAKLLLTISEFSRQRLAMALGINPVKICVVHCAATHMDSIKPDPSILEGMSLAQAPYLLAVSSQNPTKNLGTLIEAFANVVDQNLRLVLVGGGNKAVFAAGSVAQSAQEDSRIVRTGAIGDAQLKALYAGALAFVFPSIYEGFGLPPLEAMSLGCPVIASNAASIPEVCADAAEYFDPRSAADMAAAITRIVNEPGLRERLRELGFARLKVFTWCHAAHTLLAHLAQAGLVEKSTETSSNTAPT
jgi:glycosyltransferase involved in cell wall biosynthesis